MRGAKLLGWGVLTFLLMVGEACADSRLSVAFSDLVAICAPDVHAATMEALVAVESEFNPYAIGIVGGATVEAPRSKTEAIALAGELMKQGKNFSMGLTQVNRHNLDSVGETVETIFEPCRNIRAGASILKQCYARTSSGTVDEQQALRQALSCYYSGNIQRGFKPEGRSRLSYVDKVVNHAVGRRSKQVLVPEIKEHVFIPERRSDHHVATTASTTVPVQADVDEPDWGIFDTRSELKSESVFGNLPPAVVRYASDRRAAVDDFAQESDEFQAELEAEFKAESDR